MYAILYFIVRDACEHYAKRHTSLFRVLMLKVHLSLVWYLHPLLVLSLAVGNTTVCIYVWLYVYVCILYIVQAYTLEYYSVCLNTVDTL